MSCCKLAKHLPYDHVHTTDHLILFYPPALLQILLSCLHLTLLRRLHRKQRLKQESGFFEGGWRIVLLIFLIFFIYL